MDDHPGKIPDVLGAKKPILCEVVFCSSLSHIHVMIDISNLRLGRLFLLFRALVG